MADNKNSLNNQIFIKIHKIFMKIYFKIRYQNRLIDLKISSDIYIYIWQSWFNEYFPLLTGYWILGMACRSYPCI